MEVGAAADLARAHRRHEDAGEGATTTYHVLVAWDLEHHRDFALDEGTAVLNVSADYRTGATIRLHEYQSEGGL